MPDLGDPGMAQNPASTEYDGMPRSAIATGLVDFELPEAGEKQAFQTCQRIRKMVEEMQIEWEGRVIPVTVSLGLTCFNPDETAMSVDAEQLVKAADQALYKAKQTGRNTVAANFIKQ